MFKKTITALLLIIAILSLSACIKEPIEPIEPIELIDYTVYTLSYALDGGTLKITNPGSYNGKTPSFTLNNPTKEYFIFVGWSTSADLSNPVLDVTISLGTKGNTTFYAVWREVFSVQVKRYNYNIISPTTEQFNDKELGETIELEFTVDPEYYGFTVEYTLSEYKPFGESVEIVSDLVVLSDKLVIPYTIVGDRALGVSITLITPPPKNGIWVESFFLSNYSNNAFSFFSGEIGETVELELPTTNNGLFYGKTAKYYLGEKLPEGVKPQLSTIILTKKVTLKYTMTKSSHYLVFYVDEILPSQIIN